jgi:hephaestin
MTLVGIVALAACGTPQATADHTGHANLAAGATATCTGKTRTYFIAADEVQWDYAPSGKNLITGNRSMTSPTCSSRRDRTASATST